MAIDSRDKRFSLIGFALPFPGLLANPDGVIDAPDRAQALFLYAGISLTAEAIATAISAIVHPNVGALIFPPIHNTTEYER